MLIFFGLVILIISILTIIVLDIFALAKGPYNLILIRSLFILAVSIFPVVMFVLFICSRKYNLFTEFMLNLLRLGLLEKHDGEKPLNYERRIYAYINRFQEYYGPFSKSMKDQIRIRLEREKTDRSYKPIGFASYSTPEPLWAIPLFFTILIISVGWFITLPPWQTGDSPVSEISLPIPILHIIKLNPINNSINERLYSSSSLFNSTVRSTNATQPENATLDNTSGLVRVLNITQTPVTFAFLGAYFYSIQILVKRFLRRDLRINVFVAVSQRIILAIIATWVVITVPNIISSDPNPWAAIQYMGNWNNVGFIVGAFPTVIWEFLKKSTLNKFLIFIPNFTEKCPLNELDGLNIWAELRFEEEDISNVPNLATANIVDLMLTAQISAERLIYWIDQAILYNTIGTGFSTIEVDSSIVETASSTVGAKFSNSSKPMNNIEKLGHVGIRTATSLIEVYRINNTVAFWKKTGYEVEEIQSIITSIETNPNIKLIQAWRELPLSKNYIRWDSRLWFLC